MLYGETVRVDGAEIRNVIVQVGEAYTAGSQQTNIDDWQGAIADYTLHFPMTYDDDLTGRQVEVRGRLYDVIGHPDHQRPESVFGRKWRGKWDMPVRVRRTIDEAKEEIKVIAKTVDRDDYGRVISEEEITLFEGAGQARMSSGTESDRSDGTEARVSYVFVVDWLEELKDYQTQPLFVDYDSKRFNVKSVENKDEENTTAIIRGEWHG